MHGSLRMDLFRLAETQEGGGKISGGRGTLPLLLALNGEGGGPAPRNSVVFTNWERPLAAGQQGNGDPGLKTIRN